MSARPGEQRRISPPGLACAAAVAFAPAVHAADEEASAPGSGRQRAFQDHIAYVATFAMPVLIEKCAADDPDYLPRAAPAYFRFVNARQDAIERGRVLTLAELAPDDTLQDTALAPSRRASACSTPGRPRRSTGPAQVRSRCWSASAAPRANGPPTDHKNPGQRTGFNHSCTRRIPVPATPRKDLP